MQKVNKQPCRSCPFAGETPLQISPEAREEIVNYVCNGKNHLCHSDETNQTVCRGGRDIFLRIAVCKGLIEAPTDKALEKAMKQAGVNPGSHINNR
ncbi:MAG: hypothetical protein F6K24_13400 [Okeania sp. SIO2D1]|nr:hypothetical protein [Okeania sp. SIO2D1]